MSIALKYAIDVFATFANRLWLSGWIFDEKPIHSLELRAPRVQKGRFPIRSYRNIPSPDVEHAHGLVARNVRFEEVFEIEPNTLAITQAEIEVLYIDGTSFTIQSLGFPDRQRAMALHSRFRELIGARSSGALLEVGSRARSGVVRRDFTPRGWQYKGLDVVAGPNVDIVGDAHELSRFFPEERFDAIMAFSVLEHLLMPWKFVVELNRVLNVGAVGLFTTHQCWPLHDEPWDFWRFSDRAWDALLNKETGFEILEASMGEPAFVVAQRCHQVTDFGRQSGFLASNVLFRKAADTALTWPVRLQDIVHTNYPKEVLEKPPV
jgi:SAM-dependent methyltransferase